MLMSEHMKRRSNVGLGFTTLAELRGRNLANQLDWSNTGMDTAHVHVFSWNAGNLQRHAQLDTVNDLLASPFSYQLCPRSCSLLRAATAI